jgi:hypothetical protein
MVSSEWVSVATPDSPLPVVVLVQSFLSRLFELQLGTLVSSDNAHPESLVGDGLDRLLVRAISESIGTAIDGSRSGRNTSGLGSSSKAACIVVEIYADPAN